MRIYNDEAGMKPFSRIMVSLDLTEMDAILLQFVCHFIKINPFIKDIYFFHVEKDFENICKNGNGILQNKVPNDEQFRIQMCDEVKKYLDSNVNINVHYQIVEGDTLKQLLHWSRIKFIDLIITGRKFSDHRKKVFMEKLARKSECSILFVPENYRPGFSKILIPVDFSSRTDNVFEAVNMIKENLPHAQFLCQHVVEVPSGYTRIGKTYEEFSTIMIGHAKERWEKYKNEHDIDVLHPHPIFTVNENGSIAKSIIDFAHQQHVDMIMMGSKRQTGASVFFLGSVGEELVTRDKDILLLLVKYQKKPYDFFKAMKKV